MQNRTNPKVLNGKAIIGNYLLFFIIDASLKCGCLSLGITLHDEALDWAAAGDHVSLTVTGMDIIKIK